MEEFIDIDRGDWRQHETSEEREYMKVSEPKGGKDFALPDPGAYLARCFRLIDLGTHEDPNFTDKAGNPKQKRLVQLGWELLGTEIPGDEEKRPFTVYQRYNANLGEKSNLRRDLKNWRGRDFTPEELEGFELKLVLGKACMVNIIHEDSKGKTYANVQSIMPLPAGVTAPEAVNPKVYFSFDEPNIEVFEKLSDSTKQTIKSSKEGVEYFGTAEPTPAAAATPAAPVKGGVAAMEDDIPF